MTATNLDDPLCIIGADTLKDSALAAAVREGDSSAYGILFRRYHVIALRYARRHTRSQVIAEDVVMNAFIRIFCALLEQKGPTSNFRGYLFHTVRNAAAQNWREEASPVPVSTTEDLPHEVSSSPETIVLDRAEAEEQRARVEAVLVQLPDRWRQILELTAKAELSIREVAQIFGLTPNATAVLVGRARRGYRERFLALPHSA